MAALDSCKMREKENERKFTCIFLTKCQGYRAVALPSSVNVPIIPVITSKKTQVLISGELNIFFPDPPTPNSFPALNF
jgi:hypothetical protein